MKYIILNNVLMSVNDKVRNIVQIQKVRTSSTAQNSRFSVLGQSEF